MIGLNYAVEINPEIDYTLDTIFNALGLPYKKLNKVANVKPETVPVLITYGEYQLSDELLNYVKKGGYLINIPDHELIKKNEKLLKDEGYKTRIYNKFKLFGYINSGKLRDMPVFAPLFFTNEKPAGKVGLKFNRPADLKNNHCISYSKYYKGLIIYIGFDLLYSIFYVLTCKHEIDKNQWDRYNRVVEKNNLLLKNKKQNIPWVNLYFRFIEDLIKYCFAERKIPLLKKWYWPDNAGFAVWLSHDVDEVKKFTIKKSAMNLMDKKVGDSVAGLGKSFKGAVKDPYWSFSKIIELEKQHGFVSTFFFGALTGQIRKIRSGNEKVRGLEIAYNIDNKEVRSLIKSINGEGWEVGLHGSYGSFKNYKRLKAEKQVLDKATGVKCKGIRQHYLRWEHPETWHHQASCGLQYDSTLSFSNSIGFKPGYAFPYRMFSDVGNKALKLYELPLIVTDSGMGSGSQSQIDKKVRGIVTQVEKNHGLITLLFHNDRFSSTEVTSNEKFYTKVLKHLRSKKVYSDTGSAIVDWWRAREMVVLKDVQYGPKKCTWTVKPSITIKKITFKIQAPLKLLNKCKLKIGPRCKVISQETEKGINVGIITLTIDKMSKDKVYKITITK